MTEDGCAICIDGELIEHDLLSMRIKEGELKLEYSAYSCDSDFDTTLAINFCPFCGTKLGELL